MFKKQNEKGFTLIELMIVIAIIGILAAIAIPNFIAYRDKAFCSGAESDANNIAAAISDYYAIPANITFAGGAVPTAETGSLVMTGVNTAVLSGTLNSIVITVTEAALRCPASYTGVMAGWTGNVFVKTML